MVLIFEPLLESRDHVLAHPFPVLLAKMTKNGNCVTSREGTSVARISEKFLEGIGVGWVVLNGGLQVVQS